MGATSNLGLPWPEASDLADGPDALQDLAIAVENKMTGLRYYDSGYATNGYTINAGSSGDAHSNTSYPVNAIGWAEVEFEFTFQSTLTYTNLQSAANFAGNIVLFVNGASYGAAMRYHSLATPRVSMVLKRAIPLPLSLTQLQLRVQIAVDGLSTGGAIVAVDNWQIAQYGALRT